MNDSTASNDLTVSTVQAKWVEKLPPLRLASCCSLLSAAIALVFIPVAAVAYTRQGQPAVVAAIVAAGVCWFGSTLALIGTNRFGRSGINGPLYTMAIGMVFNGALPFAVGLVLNRSGGPLAEAGVFGLVMTFFLFALAVETMLSLCLLKAPREPR